MSYTNRMLLAVRKLTTIIFVAIVISQSLSHAESGQLLSCKGGSYKCSHYNATFCKNVFAHYNVSHVQINVTTTLERTEHVLLTLEKTLRTTQDTKPSCLDPSRWVICLLSMPPCDNVTCNKHQVCQEACLAIRDRLCPKEWSSIAAMKSSGLLQEDIDIPKCEILPTRSENRQCIYPTVLNTILRSTGSDKKKEGKSDLIVILTTTVMFGLLCGLLAFVFCFVGSKTNDLAVDQPSINRCSKSSHNNPLYNRTTVEVGSALVTHIPRSAINYVDELGEGAFGQVVRCQLAGEYDDAMVAVKYLKAGATERSKIAFEKEIEMLSSFHHENIINLIGACVDDDGPMCLILEFMPQGDLVNYLRDGSGAYHAIFTTKGTLPKDVTFFLPMFPFTTLVRFASQIASGMEYLSSNHFVHRDLAARNCLVGENFVIKVADFGLAHDIYASDYYRIDEQRILPVRWLPPEAMTTGTFTVHSDVWSFGVLLWELWTYGMQPYFGSTNKEVFEIVQRHELLQQPPYCPDEVYALMKECWRYQSKERITFTKLKETFENWSVEKPSFLLDKWHELESLETRRYSFQT